MEAATACDFPHLYGTPVDERYSTYGHGPDIGLSRARSENPLIATRGVALWIAAVYHETQGAARPGMEDLHRLVLRLMRQIRDLSAQSQRESAGEWSGSAALA